MVTLSGFHLSLWALQGRHICGICEQILTYSPSNLLNQTAVLESVELMPAGPEDSLVSLGGDGATGRVLPQVAGAVLTAATLGHSAQSNEQEGGCSKGLAFCWVLQGSWRFLWQVLGDPRCL